MGISASRPHDAHSKPSSTQPAAHVDEAVFVAGDGRRARRLRNAAIVAGVARDASGSSGSASGCSVSGACPGVALVKNARGRPRVKRLTYGRSLTREGGHGSIARRRGQGRPTHCGRGSRCPQRREPAAARRAAAVSKLPRRAGRYASCRRDRADARQPGARTRGWARKGYQAPRGQLRKAAPPPPPVTSRGRQVGTRSCSPRRPPAAPPGQAKKAATTSSLHRRRRRADLSKARGRHPLGRPRVCSSSRLLVLLAVQGLSTRTTGPQRDAGARQRGAARRARDRSSPGAERLASPGT